MRRQVLSGIGTLFWLVTFVNVARAAEPLSLKISTPAENVSTDADVIVTAALTNTSGRVINFDLDTGAGVRCQVEIRNSNGDMAPESGYARRHKNAVWVGSTARFPLKLAQRV